MDVDAFKATPEQVQAHFNKKILDADSGRQRMALRPSLPVAGVASDSSTAGQDTRYVPLPPMEWLKTASRCGGKSLHVGVLLWFQLIHKKRNPVKLSRHTLSEFGISTKTGRRVLGAMQDAGLVSVEFKRGRSPLVTIHKRAKPSCLNVISIEDS